MGQDAAPVAGGNRELLRAAHTLKGAAHVVRQPEIARLAHALEDSLSDPAADSVAMLRLVDAMARELDRMFPVAGVSEAEAAVPDRTSVMSGLQGGGEDRRGPGLDAALEGTKNTESDARRMEAERSETVRVELRTTTALLRCVNESGVILESMRGGLESIAEIAAKVEEIWTLSSQRGRSAEFANGRQQGTSKDLLTEVLGKLSTVRQSWVGQMDRLTREIEEMRMATVGMRLLPAGSLLLNAERVARRTAEELGREVMCHTVGAMERVDLYTLEQVDAAVMHMVRNAVVHGVEPAEVRKKAGKPEQGRIDLWVERAGLEVVFRCADDGGGVDLERLRRVMVERGWLQAAEAATASKKVLLASLQRPGVTTRGHADTVAGRGIGLDVVRSAAEKLGGVLEIESEPGLGTTMLLRVPVSQFVTPALVVESAGREVAVPLPAVVQTMVSRQHPIECEGRSEFLSLDDQYVPLVRLRAIAGWSSPIESRDVYFEDEDRAYLLLQRGTDRLVLAVDVIRGTTLLTVQPVPAVAQAAGWIESVYLNGAGIPRLVLNVAGLMQSTQNNVAAVERATPLPVLVIDDSLTSRMLEESILESAGYDVDLASSAEEGLERAAKRSYGLFLVDVEMPGMDGFEFVQRTRRDEQMRMVPAVMVTSRNLPGDRERGLNAGASEYVIKGDFQQASLLRTIGRLVRRTKPLLPADVKGRP